MSDVNEKIVSVERAGTVDTAAEATEKFPFDDFDFTPPGASPSLLVLKKARKFVYRTYVKDFSSAGATILDDDGIETVRCSTGASDQTFVLPTLADNLGRRIRFVKTDSGAGEVVLDGEGSETILWPGGSGTTVRVGRQWQSTEVEASADGWQIIRGVVQPVALEPDIGGGVHIHRAVLYSGDPANTNWTAIACAGELPDGVVKIDIDASVASAAVRLVVFSNVSGGDQHLIIHMSTATQRAWDAGSVFLDSSQQLWFQVDNADVSSLIVNMNSYCLGPV